ncbi:MAG: tRNA 2-thiouridine(34) synthase MnmA [Acidobacteria bacterium]|nr:MAG: tRNA 2-thiouridine(34) synthase MnmA [Acidobacteriota bacterium]
MTIAVAMSGGVDSSVAAALLAENNPNADPNGPPSVVGMTMQLWNQRRLPALLGSEEAEPGRASGRCCSLDDVYDARRVASFLGLPYYVVNLEDRFEQGVVRPFVESYLAGETPIPCSLCNTEIKFAEFIATARKVGADKIATGHYARVEKDPDSGRYRLLAGRDPSKDQSYFLFGLTQQQLERTLFPLGDFTKEEVRSMARERKLPVAEKPDSQEICFVPTGNYRRFIDAYLSEQGMKIEDTAGEMVTTDGRVLGRHEGLGNYTVGQRKGLGISTGNPLYVIGLDRANNRVVVGANDELLKSRLVVREINWVRPASEGDSFEARVKIRNKHFPAAARVEARAGGEAVVEFASPQRAITPGQAAVFYDGDEVVGGGWISSVAG